MSLIQEAKKVMRETIVTSLGISGNKLGDEDGGGKRFVCACTYSGLTVDGIIKHYIGPFQNCHAHLNDITQDLRFHGYGPEVMCDHIQGAARENISKLQTVEESVVYLQYLMDHPIFSKTFLEHDARKAFEERIMVRTIKELPANLCAFAIIATRALWEAPQNRLPRRFSNLIKLGVNPDLAFVLANYVDIEDTTVKFAPFNPTGHAAISPEQPSVEYVKNYLAHKPVVLAGGSLYDGKRYCDYCSYSICSIFEAKYVGAYEIDTRNVVNFKEFVKSYLQSKPATLKTFTRLKEAINA